MTLLCGIIFIIVGNMAATAFIASGILSGELIFLFAGCFMWLVFVAMGAYLVSKHVINANLKKKILREGKILTGKIVGYGAGDGVSVNGVPPLNLVVETQYADKLVQFTISTEEYSEKNYPIGAYVDFALLGVETALIKGTARFESI